MIAQNQYPDVEHLTMLGQLDGDAHSVLLRGISKTANNVKQNKEKKKDQKWPPEEREKVLKDWAQKIKATKSTALSHIDDRPLKRQHLIEPAAHAEEALKAAPERFGVNVEQLRASPQHLGGALHQSSPPSKMEPTVKSAPHRHGDPSAIYQQVPEQATE